jgi:uncharacterized OsmC-like protein
MSAGQMKSTFSVVAISRSAPYAVSISDRLGHEWLADEPKTAGGSDLGAGPVQLPVSSLGACTAITLRMYAAHKSWPLTGVEIALELSSDDESTGVWLRSSLDPCGVNQVLSHAEVPTSCCRAIHNRSGFRHSN